MVFNRWDATGTIAGSELERHIAEMNGRGDMQGGLADGGTVCAPADAARPQFADVEAADGSASDDVLDAGPKRDVGSQRTCIVTRDVCAPDALIRFVRGPDDVVVPDLLRKLPGRGAWVLCRKDIVAKAAAKGTFAKAFRAKVTVDPALAETVDALLARRAVEQLSLANKAGAAIAGQTKVTVAIEGGDAVALFQAHDAAPATRERVKRKFFGVLEALGRVPISSEVLSIAELSLAFGRENVVHAALIDRRRAAGFLAAADRLLLYRSAEKRDDAMTNPPERHSGAADPLVAGAAEKQD